MNCWSWLLPYRRDDARWNWIRQNVSQQRWHNGLVNIFYAWVRRGNSCSVSIADFTPRVNGLHQQGQAVACPKRFCARWWRCRQPGQFDYARIMASQRPNEGRLAGAQTSCGATNAQNARTHRKRHHRHVCGWFPGHRVGQNKFIKKVYDLCNVEVKLTQKPYKSELYLQQQRKSPPKYRQVNATPSSVERPLATLANAKAGHLPIPSFEHRRTTHQQNNAGNTGIHNRSLAGQGRHDGVAATFFSKRALHDWLAAWERKVEYRSLIINNKLQRTWCFATMSGKITNIQRVHWFIL